MQFERGRFSKLLRPFFLLSDLLIINSLAIYILSFSNNTINFVSISFLINTRVLFFIYVFLFWGFSTVWVGFYKVYRFTEVSHILMLLLKQAVVFTILMFAFIGLIKENNIETLVLFKYVLFVFIAISSNKLLVFYVLKSYRAQFNSNLRRVVIIGNGKHVNELESLFNRNKYLGYNLLETFRSDTEGYTSQFMSKVETFIQTNWIDEMYCDIDKLSENQINELVKIAETKQCNIKFIPKSINLVTKQFKIDFYNYLPILSIRQVALNNEFNKTLKRILDVFFSVLAIVFILSWLIPVLFILIKLESKGPLFYKHKRNGINYKEFTCYKFRSLKISSHLYGTYVKENDKRLTKIGKFLRKTSLDELPQFFNILKGDMSLVGPRPHMLEYTKAYAKIIDKYRFIFRHNVKPGLTGLAQIKGFRGEIKSDEDIKNRIKLDIYYIENWSVLLDIKIILKTFYVVLKGDKKAY